MFSHGGTSKEKGGGRKYPKKLGPLAAKAALSKSRSDRDVTRCNYNSAPEPRSLATQFKTKRAGSADDCNRIASAFGSHPLFEP